MNATEFWERFDQSPRTEQQSLIVRIFPRLKEEERAKPTPVFLPAGHRPDALFPVVTKFEVRFPVATRYDLLGTVMRFEPAEQWDCNNTYLTHAGELVCTQKMTRDEYALRWPLRDPTQ